MNYVSHCKIRTTILFISNNLLFKMRTRARAREAVTAMTVVKGMYIGEKRSAILSDPDRDPDVITWCRVQRSDITNYEVPLRVTAKYFNVKADK